MFPKIHFALCFSVLIVMTGCPDDKTTNNTPVKDMTNNQDDMRMDMAVDMNTSDMAKDMVKDVAPDADMMKDSTRDISVDISSDMMDMPQDMVDMDGSDMSGSDMTDMVTDMSNAGVGGETCSMALDVTVGGTWANQSTLGAKNDYDSGLGNDGCPVGRITGNDLVYSVTPQRLTKYKVTVTPAAGYNPMIYVKQDCAADACVDGTVLNGPGLPESLTFEALPNLTYYIIVDGQFAASGDSNGDYTLLVQKVNN